MNRAWLGALVLLIVADVAIAASVELKHNGITNDEFTMAPNTTDTLTLWITFEDDATAGPAGANVGDNAKAVWISSSIGIRSAMYDNSAVPANAHIEWDAGGPGDGGIAAPGGLYISGRIGVPSPGDNSFDGYHLIYQDGADGDFNVMEISDGWSAADGLTYHADNVKVDAGVETAAGLPQKIYIPREIPIAAWDEAWVYAGSAPSIYGFKKQDVYFQIRSRKQADHNIRIHVTPEPASFALLAVGGLAGLRHRRGRPFKPSS
ncbi:MAG: PEP-CTERM sorting domain-containing protein [bacterium]|nr:PEP-CTERM sorting domain-containing protein [bacterium]